MYDLAITGAIILSETNRYKPFVGTVYITGDLISEITHTPGLGTESAISTHLAKQTVDATGKILIPGLFNGHCHGDMTLARGLGDNMTLAEQNEAYARHNWFKEYITDEDRYYSRQLTYCEALLSGCTFICENMYWDLGSDSAAAMSEVGIRGALAQDIRYNFADSDRFFSEKALAKFAAGCKDKDIIPIISTMAEEDFETDRLLRAKDVIRDVGALQTLHLAENLWRVEIIKEKFGTTPIDYLYKNDLLGEKVIGSHVVFATDDEVKQLSLTATKVVNTPLCEMKIADGIAAIPAMTKKGVTVCLGTDGALWNNSNDIFREMKGMSLIHSMNSGVRSLTKENILDMATINGAKTFGREMDMGSIAEGKKADIVIVDAKGLHMQPLILSEKIENITSSIIYNATGGDVTDVFIGGKQVVKDKKITTVDVDFIIRKVNQASAKLI
jgi:5-methylthioadenosine/S-adenosylhomocysteine deaminase